MSDNVKNKPRDRRWLILLVATAFLLRFVGAFSGIPYDFHPDEPILIGHILDLWNDGTLRPGFFHYPDLILYSHAVLLGPTRWLLGLFGGSEGVVRGGMYLVGRTFSALCGTLTVYLVFLTARHLWSRVAGYVAGIVLCLCYLHVQNSQWISPDVPAALFAALCLYLSVRDYRREDPGTRAFLPAAAASGAAAATKYNAGLCGVTAFAFWAAGRRRLREWIAPKPLLLLAVALAAFLILNPWPLFDADARGGITHQWRHYHGGHHGFEGDHNWLYYLGYLWDTGLTPGLFLLVAIGFAVLSLRRPREALALACFPLLYYVLLSTVRVRFERNLLPLIPYLTVAAGFGGDWLAQKWRTVPLTRQFRRAVAAIAILTCVGYPLYRIVRYDVAIVQKDTRVEAYEWLSEKLKDGASLCVEEYGPPLPEGDFDVYRNWSLCADGLRDIADGDCEFAIASSRMYGRYTKDPRQYPEMAECYEFIFNSWLLIANFKGHEVAEHDPEIRILMIPR